MKWVVIAGAGVTMIALYPLVYTMMLEQRLTYIARHGSNDALSVNYIIALYLYGLWMDHLAKRIGQRKAWLLCGIGLVVIILTLKYVFGWTTRW